MRDRDYYPAGDSDNLWLITKLEVWNIEEDKEELL